MKIGTTRAFVLVLVVLTVHIHQFPGIVDHEQSEIIAAVKTILLLNQVMNVAGWTIIGDVTPVCHQRRTLEIWFGIV